MKMTKKKMTEKRHCGMNRAITPKLATNFRDTNPVAPIWNRAAALLFVLLIHSALHVNAAEGRIRFGLDGTNVFLQVQGDTDDEWRFQISEDLLNWTSAPAIGSAFSGISNLRSVSVTTSDSVHGFVRAIRTDGLFDPQLLRTVNLTFTNANWATLLANARNTGGNVPCELALDNGVTSTNVGARYRGNSSYSLGGTKKSINLDINYTDSEARVMGYRAINLNNAAGDETIMREPLYFNIMREYAPSPHGAIAKVNINGAYWGVYSMVDQNNNDLLDEWFPSHEGDRWRAPNAAGLGGGGTPGGGGGFPGAGRPTGGGGDGPPGGGGGGGGFSSDLSAFSYLGPAISSYTSNYELKSDNSTNAWERLVHAIDILNNTPTDQLRDKVEDVFAVDRWLWFLAVENAFVDDDSYWNKGADYAFYYEPESGRIHPVEHDGNETFTATMGINYTLSPLEGTSGTNRPLISKLLSIPELRQRYLSHMRTLMEERFNPDYLTPVINHFHELTLASITADTKKNFTMSAYTNDLRAVKTYVTNRYEFLLGHAELTPRPPIIIGVHGPSPVPGPADVPFITAEVRADGANGIDSVWLYWRDEPYGRFASTPMFDDGAHRDGEANDGFFGASTTIFPAGNKIHYYVEARAANSAKAAAFAPPRAEQQTFSYRVALATATNTHVLINELMADNEKTISDPQGDFDDWIELRNMTTQSIDLTGLYLTDDPENPRKWPFPADTVIPASGYLLVWADEDGADVPGLHANFKLDRTGEELLLIDTDTNLNAVLDSVSFGVQETDRSFGRAPTDTSSWISMQPTPGNLNSGF